MNTSNATVVITVISDAVWNLGAAGSQGGNTILAWRGSNHTGRNRESPEVCSEPEPELFVLLAGKPKVISLRDEDLESSRARIESRNVTLHNP